jgi:hypothetical protein
MGRADGDAEGKEDRPDASAATGLAVGLHAAQTVTGDRKEAANDPGSDELS